MTERANKELRAFAKEHGIMLWEVADFIGISEPTMTRKLRKQLESGEEQRLCRVIEHIARQKSGGEQE